MINFLVVNPLAKRNWGEHNWRLELYSKSIVSTFNNTKTQRHIIYRTSFHCYTNKISMAKFACSLLLLFACATGLEVVGAGFGFAHEHIISVRVTAHTQTHTKLRTHTHSIHRTCNTRACMRACMYMCVCVRVHACMCVCVCVCMRVCADARGRTRWRRRWTS